MLEEENIVTSPFVLLSEEETLLAIKHSSALAGINVKTAESGIKRPSILCFVPKHGPAKYHLF